MELQRLDEITKDLCKLYGEFCCELADRAKTDDMATVCALAKINDSLMDAIGGVRVVFRCVGQDKQRGLRKSTNFATP